MVPAIIMTSDWRGEGLKTMPSLSVSYLEQAVAIISMAQQARPKDMVQSDEEIPQFATLLVMLCPLTLFTTGLVLKTSATLSSVVKKKESSNFPPDWGEAPTCALREKLSINLQIQSRAPFAHAYTRPIARTTMNTIISMKIGIARASSVRFTAQGKRKRVSTSNNTKSMAIMKKWTLK